MVGLVIGLIATLVIMQTFSSFEGTKRSTTGIADAQTNGSIGLYMIQRELQFAGYGIPLTSGTLPTITAATAANSYVFDDYTNKTPAQIATLQAAALTAYNSKIVADSAAVAQGVNYSALKCDSTLPSNTINLDTDNTSTRANATSMVRDIITPVILTDGANSDSILVHYGDSTRGGLSTDISGAPAGANFVPVDNNMGCRNGDVVLVTRDASTSCFATKVATTNVQLNAIPTVVDVLSNAGMAQGDKLACLGNIREVTFDINANQLRKTNLTTGVQDPVLGEIVSLQAQYGVAATANSEIVTAWQDATGIWAPATITVANRNRIKAVRIALVARNNLLEKSVVTQLCGGAATGPARLCVFGGNLNLAGALGANWTNYRYRVYEVVVPLRNLLAASPQL
jgi:type IV pilus assembly protein PilW